MRSLNNRDVKLIDKAMMQTRNDLVIAKVLCIRYPKRRQILKVLVNEINVLLEGLVKLRYNNENTICNQRALTVSERSDISLPETSHDRSET